MARRSARSSLPRPTSAASQIHPDRDITRQPGRNDQPARYRAKTRSGSWPDVNAPLASQFLASQFLARLTPPPPSRFNQTMLMSVEADESLRALADPLRARIVELLADEQLCTCHLVELTGARQTNISNHLRVLREAGLVEPQPAGRYTFYRLRPEALTSLADHYAVLAERARSASQLRRPCA